MNVNQSVNCGYKMHPPSLPLYGWINWSIYLVCLWGLNSTNLTREVKGGASGSWGEVTAPPLLACLHCGERHPRKAPYQRWAPLHPGRKVLAEIHQQGQGPQRRFHSGQSRPGAGFGAQWVWPGCRELQRDYRKKDKLSFSNSWWRVLYSKAKGIKGPF